LHARARRREGHADPVRDRPRARGAADRRRPRCGGQGDDRRAMTAALPDGFVANLFSLEDRVAVVTGGASGLGAAIATGFAQSGAAIAIVDLDAERAAQVSTSITEAGGTAASFTADVTDSAAVDRVVADVVDTLGGVDVLVCSAGTGFRSPAEEFPEDRFDAVVAVNLKGTFLPCQRFGRVMLER